MATISNVTLAITRDVANALFDVSYTVQWSEFDRNTDLTYLASWRLIGDDTLQDGDNAAPGDDSIPLGLLFPLTFLSANGQTSTTVTVPQKTIAWANLNEDADDDEIRAVVTL